MTRKEKKAAEAAKPLAERSYWHCSKDEKTQWLIDHDADKTTDVVQPIAIALVGLIAGFLLGLVVLIMHIVARGGSGLMSSPIWIGGAVICMAAGLGVAIWRILDMKKNDQGFFINNHIPGRKASDIHHEEIEHDKQSEDNFGHESDGIPEELDL